MALKIFSQGPKGSHSEEVKPKDVAAKVQELTTGGHRNIRIGGSPEDAEDYDQWQRTTGRGVFVKSV